MRCWQCGNSLPPPEAMGQPARPVGFAPPQAGLGAAPTAQSPPPNAYSYDVIPARRSSRWLTILPVALLFVIVLGVLFAIALRSRSGKSMVPGLDDAQEKVNAYADRLRRELQGVESDSDADDPLTSQVRREIKRLSGQIGAAAPPADSQGNVHLRTGGTITREEWERARDSVSE